MALSTVPTFPSSLDAFPLVQPGDTLATNDEEHDLLHNLIVNTIAQIEQKLGIDGSVSSQSIDYIAKHHQHQGSDNSAQFARVPIRMVASQSLNPLEVQDSTGAIRSAITPAGEFLDVGTTVTTLAVRSYVSGDTFDRFQVQADGMLRWGSGAAAPATTLQRTGAGQLQLTSQLGIGITPTTFALDVSGAARFSGPVTLGGGLSAPLAVAQGGTGTTTQSFVDLTTAQTIAGVKTFSSAPVFAAPLGVASGGTGSATQNFVDLTTAQTINGVKTFGSQLLAPAGTASAPSYAFGSATGMGVYAVTPAVLGLLTPAGGWLSGRRPDGSEFFKVQQSDGTLTSYGPVSAPSVGLQTNGATIDASGTQVRFYSNTAGVSGWVNFPAGITINTTASLMGGADVAGATRGSLLTFAGDAGQVGGLPASRMAIGYDTVQFNVWDNVGGKGFRFRDNVANVDRWSVDGSSTAHFLNAGVDKIRLETSASRLYTIGDQSGIGGSDTAGNARFLYGLRSDIAGNATDVVAYAYSGAFRWFNTGEKMKLDTSGNLAIWGTLWGANYGVPPTLAAPVIHRVGNTGEPAFQNGWLNFDVASRNEAAFWKDAQGFVHLMGLIRNGNTAITNSVMFTLPSGFRPVWSGMSGAAGGGPVYTVQASGCIGRVDVDAVGSVTYVGPVQGPNNVGFLSLDGIVFPTTT